MAADNIRLTPHDAGASFSAVTVTSTSADVLVGTIELPVPGLVSVTGVVGVEALTHLKLKMSSRWGTSANQVTRLSDTDFNTIGKAGCLLACSTTNIHQATAGASFQFTVQALAERRIDIYAQSTSGIATLQLDVCVAPPTASPMASVAMTIASITVSGTLAVTGASTLTGAVTMGSTLAVTGASTLTGAVAMGSTLGVTGLLTPTGGVAATALNTHALAAAGTTYTSNAANIYQIAHITGANGTAGVGLSATIQPQILVNTGATPVLVYPPTGGTIGAASANASYSLTAGKTGIFSSNDGVAFYGGMLS